MTEGRLLREPSSWAALSRREAPDRALLGASLVQPSFREDAAYQLMEQADKVKPDSDFPCVRRDSE